MTSNSSSAGLPVFEGDRHGGPIVLWSLSEVLSRFPVGRTTWLVGVRRGNFPAPVRLSPRRVAWRPDDIQALIERLGSASNGVS